MDSWTDSNGTSELLISNDESFPKKQQYTRDGTVDFFGKPASVSKSGGQRATFFVLGATLFASLAYYGVNINLVLYLKNDLMEDNASAAMTVNSLAGFGYLMSLFGAFIGDAYMGRYWASVLFFFIYLLGNLAASILMYLPALSSACTAVMPHCPHSILKFSFFVSLYISAFGIGGYQPCVTSLGADQFDDSIEKEQVQKVSFFNLYYIFYSTGSLLANIVIVYIQEKHGYALGFALSTAAVGLAVVFFLLGTPIYRLHQPAGNPFSRVAQVISATTRNWHVKAPVGELLHEFDDDSYPIQGTRKILHSNRFRYLDKAATLMSNDETGGTQHVCTVTQVEEVKCLLSVFPVWIAIVGYGAMFAQINSTFVLQTVVMDAHVGHVELPQTYIFMFETLGVYVWALIYEQIIQPIVRRSCLRRGLTSLPRIAIGLICTMLAMVAAAVVEKFRRDIALSSSLNLETGKPFQQMSVLWQIPQYLLGGASEVFTYMGQMEFFYDQAPDSLRGIGSALSLAAMAVGSYVSNMIISVTIDSKPGWIPKDLDKGRLDLFFWFLAFLCFLNFIYFLICAHFYEYIKVENGGKEDL